MLLFLWDVFRGETGDVPVLAFAPRVAVLGDALALTVVAAVADAVALGEALALGNVLAVGNALRFAGSGAFVCK